MFLLGLTELVCMIGIPVTLAGFLIQAIRRKQNKKVWGGICIGFLAAMVACVILTPTSPDDDADGEVAETEAYASVAEEETTAQIEMKKSETEKTEEEEFAEENGISVELAESIEAALAESENSYKLHQLYNWTQIDDWAYGERYTGWMSMEYIWVFYVSGDSLQSIRQQNGMEYIWAAEGQEASAPAEAKEAADSFFTAEELYRTAADYVGQEVSVQGTILEISEFSDMNGYYLYGTKGQGLVVWIYETEKSHEIGEAVTLTGTVQNIGIGQVEITVNAPQES